MCKASKIRRGVQGDSSLHTTEARRQLHDGGKGVTPGYGCGQVGHQEAFQDIQDFILSHLNREK